VTSVTYESYLISMKKSFLDLVCIVRMCRFSCSSFGSVRLTD
jgi:hypothetical protein